MSGATRAPTGRGQFIPSQQIVSTHKRWQRRPRPARALFLRGTGGASLRIPAKAPRRPATCRWGVARRDGWMRFTHPRVLRTTKKRHQGACRARLRRRRSITGRGALGQVIVQERQDASRRRNRARRRAQMAVRRRAPGPRQLRSRRWRSQGLQPSPMQTWCWSRRIGF